MDDTLAAAQRKRYLHEIMTFFPDGEARLDGLCAAVAKLLNCQHCSLALVSDMTVFAIGSYKVPVRVLDFDRPRPFVPYERSEVFEITDEIRAALHLDLQGFDIEYLVRVPVLVKGLYVGDLIVADEKERISGLSESQWNGLQAAAELAAKILIRSKAIRSQLYGLADVVVP
jgi:hypothetical protein